MVGRIKNKINIVDLCEDNKGNVNKNIYNKVSSFVKIAQNKGIELSSIKSLLLALKNENGEINLLGLRLYNEILNIVPSNYFHIFKNICLFDNKISIGNLTVAYNMLNSGKSKYDIEELCTLIAHRFNYEF